MSDIDKKDIKQEVYDLYDDYAHNRLNRRTFMEKLSLYAVGSLTVPALMSFLMPNYAPNLQISADDSRLQSDFIHYDSPKGGGSIKALLSMPKGNTKKLGGVIVVHENRGLNPYIEDVGRRAALAGFISIAPDALSPLGGYPGNDDEGRVMQSKRSRAEMEEDFIAAYQYLKNHKNCNGKIAVVGFCFGGAIANMMAVRVPDLAAAVPFYGSQPAAVDVPKIQAPIMMHNASLDTRIMEGLAPFEAALKANGKKYESFVYPNVNHGFHNDSTPRYDKPAAELAWNRTIDFFKQYLK